MTNIGKDQPAHHSHLFTVRLWAEDLGHGQVEWHGQVQHVLSGETRYFRDWATLVEFVRAMCRRGLLGKKVQPKVNEIRGRFFGERLNSRGRQHYSC